MKREAFNKVEDQVYDPRTIGKKNCKVQVLFTVQTQKSILELVKYQKDYIKKKEISLSTKETRKEHTTCISIIIRVNIQFASKKWHKQNIENRAAIKEDIIELK